MEATLRMETPHRRPADAPLVELYERAMVIGPFSVPPDFIPPDEATLPHPQNRKILDVYALKSVEESRGLVRATYVYRSARKAPSDPVR